MTKERELFDRCFGLLREAEAACRKLRLCGDDLTLPHETRMFARQFSPGGDSEQMRRELKELRRTLRGHD